MASREASVSQVCYCLSVYASTALSRFTSADAGLQFCSPVCKFKAEILGSGPLEFLVF